MHFSVVKVILISIILCSLSNISAQKIENEKSFWFGFQTGINTSFFNSQITEYSDINNDFDPFVRISALIGLKSKIQLSNKFALISELNVSSRGGSYRAENNSVFYLGSDSNKKSYYMRNFRLTYLEIPVLMNFNLNQLFPSTNNLISMIPKSHSLSFSAGIAPSINIGSSFRYNSFTEGETISGPLVEMNSDYDTQDFDYAKSTLLNSIFGLTYNFPYEDNSIISIILRWTQSLNNVYDVDTLDDYNMQTKMSTITLGASIMF